MAFGKLFVFFAIFTVCELIQLETKLGNVTGIDEILNNKTFHSFYGIPYAKPPVDTLRFKKPEPMGKFKYHNGTVPGNRCIQCERRCFLGPQAVITGKEDCLILNIQTPVVNKTDLKPVMVWIHGGGYVAGTANSYSGDAFVVEKDVIFVAINYRLGLLGFPAVEDGEISNNLGLWDQHTALKWISENIIDYGGDNSKITIFGVSAGGSSVMAQILSPHNNNTIFQRAISQSGALKLMHIDQVPPISLDNISKALNCSSVGSKKALECMQKLNGCDIIRQSYDSNQLISMIMSDSTFFPNNMIDSISNTVLDFQSKTKPENLQHIKQYDYMAGWNDNDGLLTVGLVPPVNATHGSITDAQMIKTSFAQTLVTLFTSDKTLFEFVSDVILTAYQQSITSSRIEVLKERTPDEVALEVLKLFAGDANFVVSTIQTLRLHQIFNPTTYAYEYSHLNSWPGSLLPVPDWLRTGANHAEEVPLIFGNPLLDLTYVCLPINGQRVTFNYTDTEKMLSRVMLDYWTSFAINGKPETNQSDRVWNEYSDDFNYARIGDNKTTMKTRLRHDMINLLTAIDDAYVKSMNQPVASTTTSQPSKDKSTTVKQSQYQYSIKSPLSADQMFTVMIVVTVITGALFIITLIVCIKFKCDLSVLKKITKKENYAMD